MSAPSSEATARKTVRLEAFSDAVLAIAITLPIAELKVPEVGPNGDLQAALIELWPSYLAYVMSFLVIGIYWARSHFLGKILEKTDHAYNLLDLLFLGSVSIFPFPARAFSNHVQGDANSRTAGVFYAAALLVPALLWTIKWFYSVNRTLVDPRIVEEYMSRGKKVYVLTTVGLAVSTALTFVNWRAGTAIASLITLAYLLPPKSPDYKLGEEPADELEEAEDRRGK